MRSPRAVDSFCKASTSHCKAKVSSESSNIVHGAVTSPLSLSHPLTHTRTAKVSFGCLTGTIAKSATSLVCLATISAPSFAPYTPNNAPQTAEELARPAASTPAADPPTPKAPRIVVTPAPTRGAASPPVTPTSTPPAIAAPVMPTRRHILFFCAWAFLAD